MKKIALRFLESFVLCVALVYLTSLSINVFLKLIGLLPVEFVVYKPLSLVGFAQTAAWSALIIALCATVLEWKRERRKVSYLIFTGYLLAPFVASLILFLITAWRFSQIDAILLERMGGHIRMEEIPLKLTFVGYALFPVAHFSIVRFIGRSSRSDQPM